MSEPIARAGGYNRRELYHNACTPIRRALHHYRDGPRKPGDLRRLDGIGGATTGMLCRKDRLPDARAVGWSFPRLDGADASRSGRVLRRNWVTTLGTSNVTFDVDRFSLSRSKPCFLYRCATPRTRPD